MKTIIIPNDMENLFHTGVYHDIERVSHKVPICDRYGKRMGPWNARPRRKITRGNVNGVAITRALYRKPDKWTVFEETRFASPDFVAEFEAWWSWEFDPAKPFPHKNFDEGIWDQLSGDWFGLAITGSLGHFLKFVGPKRKISRQIIRACEMDGVIDAQEAMLARLVI